jgi:cell division septal protein FtsQ
MLGWFWYHPQPLAALMVVALILTGMWRFFSFAEAFAVEHVDIPSQVQFNLPQGIEGRNIWQVDIRSLASDFHRQQPWLEQVRVIRRLPDTIVVQPIQRIPIAVVRLGRWHPIDTAGFILPQEYSVEDLPKLSGFQKAGVELVAGQLNDHPIVLQSLRVLKRLQVASVLAGRRVEELDATDANMLRFTLNGGLEVFCGREIELDQHLQRLADALAIIEERGMDVRYIDVRFQDPVVAPKDAP